MARVPPNTTIKIDGDEILVIGYVKELDCYRVSYDGPGVWAGRILIEEAYAKQQGEHPRQRP